VTSSNVGFVARWSCDGREPPPLVRLVLRAFLCVHNALTSGFALALVSKIRVSRGFFSGPYQSCVRMRMQGVRGETWPVSCGSAAMGGLGWPGEVLLRARAQGMHMHCPDQRDLDGAASGVLPGVLPWHPVGRSGHAFGARWFRSRLGTLQSRAVRSGYPAQVRRLPSSPDHGDLLPPARRLANRPADRSR